MSVKFKLKVKSSKNLTKILDNNNIDFIKIAGYGSRCIFLISPKNLKLSNIYSSRDVD